jgi:hypothetical protein
MNITETRPNFSRLYRAFVSSRDYREPERTAFVEAYSHNAAAKKIADVVAALEFGSTPEQVQERIYNCSSGQELIDEGLSEDLELRLFETGWTGGKATHFVEEPLFLLDAPATLIRVWARIRIEPESSVQAMQPATAPTL